MVGRRSDGYDSYKETPRKTIEGAKLSSLGPIRRFCERTSLTQKRENIPDGSTKDDVLPLVSGSRSAADSKNGRCIAGMA